MEPDPRPLDSAKIAAGRLWAATAMPYLASALFAVTVRAVPESRTIAVDRSWRLHADPEVVDELSPPELGRLFLHLLGHLIRDHATRAESARVGDDGAPQWNRCADAEINDDLDMVGCRPSAAPELPRDLDGAPAGLAETYYLSAPPGPRRWDCGSGSDGIDRPWDGPGVPAGMSPRQGDLLRLSLAAQLQREHARDPGSVPAGWIRWAEAVLPSRVDWRRQLASEIRAGLRAVAGQVDYSYRRPSRRQSVSLGVILPSLVQPVPEVAIVCDTSGSMHDTLLARALAEVEGILRSAGIRSCPVLAVDTVVHTRRRVQRAAQVRLGGGGGTDMAEGIAAAAELKPRPSIVIVLTDGYTPWPDRPPPMTRVIIGLLAERHERSWDTPEWAKTVLIEDGIV